MSRSIQLEIILLDMYMPMLYLPGKSWATVQYFTQ